MSTKLTQKELRAPDAFQRVGAVGRRWLEQRRTLALGAAVLAVVVALGAAIASSVSSRQEQQAASALGAALKPLDRPVGEALPGDDQKPFATQADKDQAVLASLTPFGVAHPGTVPAVTATLPLASAQLRLTQADGSLAHFGDFLAHAPTRQILRVSALEGEGYGWEAKGLLDRALEAFERMSREDAGGFLAGMGLYHRARILAMQGKKLEAASAFQELVTAQPGTPAARLAEDRLALLATEGIRPPAAPPARLDAG